MENHITKEEAHELLQEYLYSHNDVLPKHDAIITSETNENGQNIISEYTFRYLLKIAYSLK